MEWAAWVLCGSAVVALGSWAVAAVVKILRPRERTGQSAK
jgi:hypothetical protein